ncbi:hypothetical protein MHK_005806 [Candidatus Magnetomorum sp. HK-1]|nr:hypothetical protein MHK_005806 [Candidatus Magnetomorum sp. HK-1]
MIYGFTILGRLAFAGEPQAVRELISETHTLNVPLPYTQIVMNWSSPEGYTVWDGYFVSFDQNNDSNFSFDKHNTVGNPINSNQVKFSCSGDDNSYYFHIAPAKYNFETYEYLFGTTTNMGPYRIDTTPPYNLVANVPEYCSENPINIQLSAEGASNVCVSNIGFGSCQEETWEEVDTINQWNVLPGQGQRMIYITFEDLAGNTANTFCTTTFDSIAPKAHFSVAVNKKGNFFLGTIMFEESVTELNELSISADNAMISNLAKQESAYTPIYTFDIKTSHEGLIVLNLSENEVIDNAGNGNIEQQYSFTTVQSVPTMNEWGVLLLTGFVMIAGVTRTRFLNQRLHF